MILPKTHGLTNTRLYSIFGHMKQRCYDKNSARYHCYGGRGITICEEWRNDFQTFYDWAMSHGYADNLTIDRIDVNGNYEPSNCRFVTIKEQENNRSNNRLITYNGMTKTLSQWASISGLSYGTFYHRIKRGWSFEDCLTAKKGEKIK